MRFILYGIMLMLSVVTCFARPSFAAEERPTVVFLEFVDNSNFKNMNPKEIISSLLLDDLMQLDKFEFVDFQRTQETITAQDNLFAGRTASDNKGGNNFSGLLAAADNDVTHKEAGEYVSAKDAQIIGRAHNAQYILQGTIDYLGEGIKDTASFLPIAAFGIGAKQSFLEARVTVRMIDTADGKVVWYCSRRGVAKNNSVDFNDLAINSESDSGQLFEEALEKVSKKITKTLFKDIKSGKCNFI